MGNQTLTDKEFFTEIYNQAKLDFDKFVALYGNYFHEELRSNYFDGNMGEYVELEGKSSYFKYLKDSVSKHDLNFDKIVISDDKQMLFVFFRQVITEKSPYFRKNLPPLDGLGIFYIENNQIVKIKPIIDTFQVLKNIGKAAYQSKDKDRINQYIQNLINIGILESSHIKSNNVP